MKRQADRISPAAVILAGAAIRIAMVLTHDLVHNADGAIMKGSH